MKNALTTLAFTLCFLSQTVFSQRIRLIDTDTCGCLKVNELRYLVKQPFKVAELSKTLSICEQRRDNLWNLHLTDSADLVRAESKAKSFQGLYSDEKKITDIRTIERDDARKGEKKQKRHKWIAIGVGTLTTILVATARRH